ncbi:MAG: amino acid permease [Marmoricola sp.]
MSGQVMAFPELRRQMMGAPPTELRKGHEQRHLTMIAIGGVIGAGLFVGSGVVINDAGPGAFLTYGVTGVLIVMVMRMLGEMATAKPSTGSFADYARKALGGWAAFRSPGCTGTSG